MVKLSTALQVILIPTFLFSMISSAIILFTRMNMPYNSEGRYFDQTSGVAYHEQAIIAYTLSTILMALLLTVTIIWTVKTVRR